ncbi:HNH endonuclease [Mesorhizobium sp. WSM2561]|uniref:HNH endonuclease n=1 Tax=Mesorhizobium sp. WSM2561 TaxID=1040985 RepID=UPI000482787B|nr:HNH endonuclease [Mesorhizobium sp. WSM2561]
MIGRKKDLIRKELEEGTGAAIAVAVDESGLRSGLRIWFADLEEKHGPVAELRPHGLRGHRVELAFGKFSGAILTQIRQAQAEDIQLARALVSSINSEARIEIPGQDLAEWAIDNGNFRMTATIRHEAQPDDAAVSVTCREVIVPMMAALAELIGYDVITEEATDETPAYEGATLLSVVRRRERNPRNRLLCIRIHGEKCTACGLEPRLRYGIAGAIIEVHHLEPLASLATPRPYDPANDLVPLCPNCHRAIHTRRPIPFSIDDLKAMKGDCFD